MPILSKRPSYSVEYTKFFNHISHFINRGTVMLFFSPKNHCNGPFCVEINTAFYLQKDLFITVLHLQSPY